MFNLKIEEMKTYTFVTILFISILFSGLSSASEVNKVRPENHQSSLKGKWIRISPSGPIAITFKENGKVDVDFGNNGEVNGIVEFKQKGNKIWFEDSKGEMCAGIGHYKFHQTRYYLVFNVLDDNCGGRIKATMGYWTKPEYEDLLFKLDCKITSSSNPDLLLHRARIYMALGKSKKAKNDLDKYLKKENMDAVAYVNRAATRFPFDFEGVITDCSKAITIDSRNKNAFFLRGLARYEIGEKEKGCADFRMAIQLGFTFLEKAEYNKCASYW